MIKCRFDIKTFFLIFYVKKKSFYVKTCSAVTKRGEKPPSSDDITDPKRNLLNLNMYI